MPEEVIARAPDGLQVQTEIRKIIVTGLLDTGEEIAQEREIPLPKGMDNLEPVANLIWSQLGGMSKTVDSHTFKYYPLNRFKEFTLEVSSIITGNSLILP